MMCRRGLYAVLSMLLIFAAKADNIVSKPVGFVRIEVPANDSTLCAVPFYAFTPSIQSLFEGQMTGGSNEVDGDQIHKWDAVNQQYLTAFKADGTGNPLRDGFWFESGSAWIQSDLTFAPGEAFWVENRQDMAQYFYVYGNVILDDANTVVLSEALSLFSYPFSTKIALNDTDLFADGARIGTSSANADTITAPHDDSQYWLKTDGVWQDTNNLPTDMEVTIGKGYWYNRADSNSLAWSETRPYANAFPENNDPPQITDLQFNSDGSQVILHIAASGGAGESLEIYYQDADADGAFNSVSGWQLLVSGIDPDGQTSCLWTNIVQSPSNLYARFYMVARGDIDINTNGVADAREQFRVDGTNGDGLDSDSDGMPDYWELMYGFNLNDDSDASLDADADCVSNAEEFALGTDPLVDTVAPVIACNVPELANRSFENGNGPGGMDLYDWIEFGSVYHESNVPNSGSSHAKVFGRFNGQMNWNGFYQDLPAVEGQQWRAQAHIMIPSFDALAVDNRAFFKIEFYNAGYQLLQETESDSLNANDPLDQYIPLVLMATAPADTAYVRFVCLVQQNNNAPGAAFFDDVELTLLKIVADAGCEGVMPDLTGLVSDLEPCGPLTIIQDPAAGTLHGAGFVPVELMAFDESGNSSACGVVVEVLDETPPVLQGVPADVTVEYSAIPAPAGVIAIDACDAGVVLPVDFVEDISGGCPQILTRTWSATDADGNAASATQTIIVEDTTPPTISFDMPVLVNDSFEDGNGPGGMDLYNWIEFGNVYHESFGPRSGDAHAKVFGMFNGQMNWCGLYQDLPAFEGQQWRASAFAMIPSSDALAGNNRAFVKIEYFNQAYQRISALESSSVTAADEKDVYLPLAVSAVAPADTAYVRIVCMVEQSGDAPGAVWFDDTELTLLKVTADEQCEGMIPDLTGNAIATDYSGVVGISQSPEAGSVVGIGENIISLQAEDVCGNMASCQVAFLVVDMDPPELLGVPTNTTLNYSDVPVMTELAVSDPCDVDVVVTMGEVADIEDGAPTILTRTWVAEDPGGNRVEAQQVITVYPDHDTDLDGMDDRREWDIINFNPYDGLETLEDVDPYDDFDEDGYSNIQECRDGYDPTIIDHYIDSSAGRTRGGGSGETGDNPKEDVLIHDFTVKSPNNVKDTVHTDDTFISYKLVDDDGAASVVGIGVGKKASLVGEIKPQWDQGGDMYIYENVTNYSAVDFEYLGFFVRLAEETNNPCLPVVLRERITGEEYIAYAENYVLGTNAQLCTDWRWVQIPITNFVNYYGNSYSDTNNLFQIKMCKSSRGTLALGWALTGWNCDICIDDLWLMCSSVPPPNKLLFHELYVYPDEHIYADCGFPIAIEARNFYGDICDDYSAYMVINCYDGVSNISPSSIMMHGGELIATGRLHTGVSAGQSAEFWVHVATNGSYTRNMNLDVISGSGSEDELTFVEKQRGIYWSDDGLPLVKNQREKVGIQSHLYTCALSGMMFVHAGINGRSEYLDYARQMFDLINTTQNTNGSFYNSFNYESIDGVVRLASTNTLTGNNSWYLMSLGYYTLMTHDDRYKEVIRSLADYLIDVCQVSGNTNGCDGGLVFNPMFGTNSWKYYVCSTEHQTEAYAGLKYAAQVWRDDNTLYTKYTNSAGAVLDYITNRVFRENVCSGYSGFLTGIDIRHGETAGSPLNTDPQTWGVLSFAKDLQSKYGINVLPALDLAISTNLYGDTSGSVPASSECGWDNFWGNMKPGSFWYATDKKGIWLEGTAQLGVALDYAVRALGAPASYGEKSDEVFDAMSYMQHPSGGFQTFSCNYECWSSNDYPQGETEYPAVAATAWRYFDIEEINPYQVPTVHYVSPEGNNTVPFDSWDTASTSINDAVQVAEDGDIILVTNGCYILDAEIQLDKRITVKSVNGPDVTMVDGAGAYRCFYLTEYSRVEGFAITNGYTDLAVADAGGSGVRCQDGGIVRNCIVSGCLGWKGGGIRCEGDGFIDHCIIRGNRSEGANGCGAGVYLNGGGTICNSLIVHNQDDMNATAGAGVYCNAGAIQHCTIADNHSAEGAGVRVENWITLENTIIWGNEGGNIHGVPHYNNNNCIGGWTGGGSVITDDPQFVSDSSYRLVYGTSPCVNTGVNSDKMNYDTDISGNPRILYETTDMGCYENVNMSIELVSHTPPEVLVDTTTITLSGTGVNVTEVGWYTEAGDSGVASGTSSWTISDLSLPEKTNHVTVWATDGSEGTTTVDIVIYRDLGVPAIHEAVVDPVEVVDGEVTVTLMFSNPMDVMVPVTVETDSGILVFSGDYESMRVWQGTVTVDPSDEGVYDINVSGAEDQLGIAMESATHVLSFEVLDTTPPVLQGVPEDCTVECDAIPDPADVTAYDSGGGVAAPGDGLILHYSFNQDEGGVVSDASGYDNDATIQGATHTAQGIDAGAYEFDGANDYMQLTDSASLRPAHISVSVWVKPARDYSSGSTVFFTKEHSGGPGGYVLRYMNGAVDFMIMRRGEYRPLTHICTLEQDHWYHLVGTFDGEWQRLYINGELVEERHGFVSIYHRQDNPRIGASADSTPKDYFDGIIDEVRLYNRGLNGDDVSALYQSDSQSLPVTYTEEVSGLCPQIITRTWRAVDASGNSSVETQVITVQDTTPPQLTGVPDDLVLSTGDDIPDPATVTATDNCGGVSLPDASLVLYYSMDTDESGVVSDESGNSNDAVNHGAVHTTQGVMDGAYQFDGVYDYMQLTDSASLKPQYVTVSLWIQPAQTYSSGRTVLFTKENSGGPGGYVLRYMDGALEFMIMSGSTYYPLSHVCTLQQGQWYHVVGTYDGSRQCLYINGLLVKEVQQSITINHTSTNPRIGASADPYPKDYFNGIIDEVRIYSEGLSEDQVTSLFQGESELVVSFEEETFSTSPLEIRRTWSAEDACGNSVSDMQIIQVIEP